jgi:hypothetical protein
MKQAIVVLHLLLVMLSAAHGMAQGIDHRISIGLKIEAERGVRIQPTKDFSGVELDALDAHVSSEAALREPNAKLVTADYSHDHINVHVMVAKTRDGLYIASSVSTLYFAKTKEDKFLTQDVLASSDLADLAKAICSDIHAAAGLAESEGVE